MSNTFTTFDNGLQDIVTLLNLCYGYKRSIYDSTFKGFLKNKNAYSQLQSLSTYFYYDLPEHELIHAIQTNNYDNILLKTGKMSDDNDKLEYSTSSLSSNTNLEPKSLLTKSLQNIKNTHVNKNPDNNRKLLIRNLQESHNDFKELLSCSNQRLDEIIKIVQTCCKINPISKVVTKKGTLDRNLLNEKMFSMLDILSDSFFYVREVNHSYIPSDIPIYLKSANVLIYYCNHLYLLDQYCPKKKVYNDKYSENFFKSQKCDFLMYMISKDAICFDLKLILISKIELYINNFELTHEGKSSGFFHHHGSGGYERAKAFKIRLMAKTNCLEVLEETRDLFNKYGVYKEFNGRINVNESSLATYVMLGIQDYFSALLSSKYPMDYLDKKLYVELDKKSILNNLNNKSKRECFLKIIQNREYL